MLGGEWIIAAKRAAPGRSGDQLGGGDRFLPAAGQPEARSRSLGCQEGLDGDVLVDRLPVDADSPADETPIRSLVGPSVPKTGKPLQGHRDLPAIGKNHAERILGKRDVRGQGFYLHSQWEPIRVDLGVPAERGPWAFGKRVFDRVIATVQVQNT